MKIGHQVTNPEFMEATVTIFCRVDHVFGKTVEMPDGLYKGSSGGPMIDEDGNVACIHVDSVSQIDFPNKKRLLVTDVASEVSSNHASSRHGSIVFNIDALIKNLNNGL